MSHHAMPPLHALRAFEAVGRHLSFKLAADELAVTPTALSHQVRTLEEYLGTRLVDRLHRRIRLSEAGRSLHPGLAQGFETIRETLARFRPSPEDAVLVVSCGPGFGAKWLAPRLWRFADAHPQIDVRLSANIAFTTFAGDGVDVAIRFGEGRYPGLFSEFLVGDRVLPLASPSFIEERGLFDVADLETAPLIHDESMSFAHVALGWSDWFASIGRAQVETARGIRFSHADHALDAAIAGAGVVLGRYVLAADDIVAGRLAAPFDAGIETGFAFHVVCPQGTETKPKIAAFRQWLKAAIEDSMSRLSEKMLQRTKKGLRFGG